jgi:deazaflavin-dependent oxidoreductase (nitroreductase family)
MAVRRGPILKAFWRWHKWILKASGGRLLANIGKLSVLVLHTRGHASGEPRTTVLSFVPYEQSYVVVASNAGAGHDPAWWRNLQQTPRTEIEIRGRRLAVTWRQAAGAEAEQLYTRFVQADPSYAEYQSRTSRPIPVVVLTPAA